MSQTPTYLTQTLLTQLLQLAKKMPGGEELIVADGRVKIRKDGEEQFLEETSPKPPTEVDEYLDEFRIIRTDEKVLPKIDGDEDNQLTTILGKLKVTRNSNAFEYYYLLGKLIEEYPATMKKKIHQKCQYNYNKSGKIVRMAKRTVMLFNTIGLSYLPPQRLRLSTLWEMMDGNFEKLMIGIRAIVAEWLQASLLWDDILNDLTFPASQELNAGAEKMQKELSYPNIHTVIQGISTTVGARYTE
ncbi:1558_t:CDS:2, partial [Entrophospora sp. SA101]